MDLDEWRNAECLEWVWNSMRPELKSTEQSLPDEEFGRLRGNVLLPDRIALDDATEFERVFPATTIVPPLTVIRLAIPVLPSVQQCPSTDKYPTTGASRLNIRHSQSGVRIPPHQERTGPRRTTCFYLTKELARFQSIGSLPASTLRML